MPGSREKVWLHSSHCLLVYTGCIYRVFFMLVVWWSLKMLLLLCCTLAEWIYNVDFIPCLFFPHSQRPTSWWWSWTFSHQGDLQKYGYTESIWACLLFVYKLVPAVSIHMHTPIHFAILKVFIISFFLPNCRYLNFVVDNRLHITNLLIFTSFRIFLYAACFTKTHLDKM